jgi:AcrR family transcriptional regulator
MVRTVKKPHERRSEILAAARQLLQTRDYRQTTMQQLMDTLQVAKGTIYHYFRSKEELLEAVAEQIVEEDLDRKRALMEQTKGDAIEKLRVLITAGNLADGHEEILDQLHTPEHAGMHARQLAIAVKKLAPLYEELFRQGCREGLFSTETPRESAEFVLSAVQFLTDRGLYPWSEEDLQRRIAAVPALLEAQLGATPGAFAFLTEHI